MEYTGLSSSPERRWTDIPFSWSLVVVSRASGRRESSKPKTAARESLIVKQNAV